MNKIDCVVGDLGGSLPTASCAYHPLVATGEGEINHPRGDPIKNQTDEPNSWAPPPGRRMEMHPRVRGKCGLWGSTMEDSTLPTSANSPSPTTYGLYGRGDAVCRDPPWSTVIREPFPFCFANLKSLLPPSRSLVHGKSQLQSFQILNPGYLPLPGASFFVVWQAWQRTQHP